MHWDCLTPWSSITDDTNCKCGWVGAERASSGAMMINRPVVGVAVAVVVVAAGTWYFLHSRHSTPPTPIAAQQPAPPEPAEPAIQHPLPEAPANAPAAPLPALADSDPALIDALSQVAGTATVKEYLLPENIVRHMVVTIDNLPRQKVAVQKRPTGPVGGSFVVVGDELHATLDPQNFARYQPMVTVISKLDMQKLAGVYV